MDANELAEIVRKNVMWLNNEPGGERANLRWAILREANLQEANLREANLWGACGRALHVVIP